MCPLRNYRHDRPTRARRGIILETLPYFHDRARLLVRTLSEEKFCCFVQENRLEYNGWLFKQGHFVTASVHEYCTGANGVACGKPSVLKMP